MEWESEVSKTKKYHCQISLPKDLDPLGAQGLGLNVAKTIKI
jgi:hypothetical protein